MGTISSKLPCVGSKGPQFTGGDWLQTAKVVKKAMLRVKKEYLRNSMA